MQLLLYMCSTGECVLHSEPEILTLWPAHNHYAAWCAEKLEGEKKKPNKNPHQDHEHKMKPLFSPKTWPLSGRQLILYLLWEEMRTTSLVRRGLHTQALSRTDTVHGCRQTNSMLPKHVDSSFLSVLSCLVLPFPLSVLRLVWLLRVSTQLSNPEELFLLAEFALTLVSRPGSLSGIWIVVSDETLRGNWAAHQCARMHFGSYLPFLSSLLPSLAPSLNPFKPIHLTRTAQH